MNTENDSFFVDMTLGQGTQSNYLFAPRTPHPAPRTPHPAPHALRSTTPSGYSFPSLHALCS